MIALRVFAAFAATLAAMMPQERRLADAIVPSSRPVELEVPPGTLGRLLGATSVGGGESGTGGIGVDEKERRRAEKGRAKTLGVTLVNATVREILNALCRAHGTLSWSATTHEASRGQRSYTVGLKSYDGWSVSRTFRMGS